MDFKTLFSDPVLLLTGKDELLSFLIPWLMKMWRHVSKLKENTFQIMCLISEVTVETLNWNASYFNLSTAIPKDRVGQIVPSWCRTFFPELQLVNWLLHLWVSVHWSAWLSERGRKNTILKIQMLKNYFTCLVCGLVLTYLAFFFFFICRNSSEPILSIFQAALISNGTCKYSAAFHHFGVRAKHLLLHSCDLLGRESMSCMMTGIVFFISLSVVFPGKNGYL